MHDHWQSVISARTSSKEAMGAMVRQIGKITELESDHDFQGRIEKCVKTVTDWFSTASRSGDGFDGNPFEDCSNILDLIAASMREKQSSPHRFVPPFAVQDEELVYEIEGMGRVSRLTTPEAVIRETYCREACLTHEVFNFPPAPVDGEREYWTARSVDGDVVALGENVDGIVWSVSFEGPFDRRAAENLVSAYIVERQLSMATATAVSGLVRGAGGEFYRLAELPPGLEIKGDVHLRDAYSAMINWSENITVDGDLTIEGVGAGNAVAPAGLHVSGSLMWSGDGLSALGDGLVVDGDATFYCRNLVKAGIGCRFGGNLSVKNTAILREKFAVTGKVYKIEAKQRREVAYPRRSLVRRILRFG
jgi:hypothetical protein